jgi:phosphate transport system protein
MPGPLRAAFHERLAQLRADLQVAANRAADAIDQATTAALDGDPGAADEVITLNLEQQEWASRTEDECMQLLALEGPVAGELRLLVDSLSISGCLARMGGLAAHVAEAALRSAPDSAVPAPARGTVRELGVHAAMIARKTSVLIGTPSQRLAEEIERDDDVLDALHRKLFGHMLAESWPAGVEGAISVALLGRYYERFADQAVNACRRVTHTLTGSRPH